jgi:hypothetical protein
MKKPSILKVRKIPDVINKVTVALAAKIARIAWVVINRPGAVYEVEIRRSPDALA